MVADSDGEMESHDLDVKYPAIFSAYDRLVKISLVLVSIFFKHCSLVVRNFNFAVAMWMEHQTRKTWSVSVSPLASSCSSCAKMILTLPNVPTFEHSEMLGEKYDDSVYFSDVSMLRGHVHRIVRLRVWHSQRDEFNPYAVWSKGPAGLQCLHNIEGGYMWLMTMNGSHRSNVCWSWF